MISNMTHKKVKPGAVFLLGVGLTALHAQVAIPLANPWLISSVTLDNYSRMTSPTLNSRALAFSKTQRPKGLIGTLWRAQDQAIIHGHLLAELGALELILPKI
jgi:hypothetical protein